MASPAGAARAVLLLGPTGSGKTPLGELLAERGWHGRRCVHFDFGAQLRAVASGAGTADALSAAERDLVAHVLRTGALLEDSQFSVAARILAAFIAATAPGPSDWLVLNGLPRHVTQAQAVQPLARIERVIHLSCAAAVVLHRIRADVGGDRAGRTDDTAAEVAAKLDTYRQRTEPLLQHFRAKGVAVQELVVQPDTTPETAWQLLQRGPVPG